MLLFFNSCIYFFYVCIMFFCTLKVNNLKFFFFFGIAFEFSHRKQSNSMQRTFLRLTRMVSCVGMWPGPPPVFSGLKVDLGLHRKAGLRMYPQRPLARKRPWFRSICSPGVWKFRATAKQQRGESSSVVAGMHSTQCRASEMPSCRKHKAVLASRDGATFRNESTSICRRNIFSRMCVVCVLCVLCVWRR